MSPRPAFLHLALLILISPTVARAQWQFDGTPLSTVANNQQYPAIVSDGSGGAIVAWEDFRSGTADIYAQRVDAAGVPQWTAGGIALCAAAGNQLLPRTIADGSGGAIVTWDDYRGGTYSDIYAQRVDAAGTALWGTNGLAVSAAGLDQKTSSLTSDGAGGAIIAWQDYRFGAGTGDIFSQRIDASGTPLWLANGEEIINYVNNQVAPTIITDGSGGAIIIWLDYRSNTNWDIYAQRVDASGTVQWASTGVVLCAAANDQQTTAIASDGSGGAIVAWWDNRSGTTTDIYAQRVNASGGTQWVANGAAVCTAAADQYCPAIASDGLGGAIVSWCDYRNGSTANIYAQRVDAFGVPQWTSDGVAVCTAAAGQAGGVIVADGSGGVIATWWDYRSGVDIYAQRVNINGVAQWTADGVAVSTAANDQFFVTITADGSGGAIIAWTDKRSGAGYDIFAQRVEPDFGTWGTPEPQVTSAADVPGDQGGKVAVNWKRSGHDVLSVFTISHYSVWRAIDPVAFALLGPAPAWVDPSSVGPDFHGTAVAHERVANTDYYWEWVANQDPTHDAGYSFAVSTRQDSLSSDPAVHYFRVIAHTGNPYVLYKSNVLAGYSVDNLAPPAPLVLTAQRIGFDVRLHWNRVTVPDLRDYALYRATSSGVTPAPIYFLNSVADTTYIDPGVPTGSLYYIVTAYDVHENQSAPSNEATVSGPTGVGDLPPVGALTLRQNHPNPFTAATELEIGLPAASAIGIEVYDVTGRRVRAFAVRAASAGWQRVPFAGVDDSGAPLASGVYFYRVTANGTTVTRKMVIAR